MSAKAGARRLCEAPYLEANVSVLAIKEYQKNTNIPKQTNKNENRNEEAIPHP